MSKYYSNSAFYTMELQEKHKNAKNLTLNKQKSVIDFLPSFTGNHCQNESTTKISCRSNASSESTVKAADPSLYLNRSKPPRKSHSMTFSRAVLTGSSKFDKITNNAVLYQSGFF